MTLIGAACEGNSAKVDFSLKDEVGCKLTLEDLARCAWLATHQDDEDSRKVFVWWCAHLIQYYWKDGEVMGALKNGSTPVFWDWLFTKWCGKTSSRILPWREMMFYLQKMGKTLEQFFNERLKTAEARPIMAIAYPVIEPDVAVRSNIEKKPTTKKCWDRLTRQERAKFLTDKIVKRQKITARSSQSNHLANILYGYRRNTRRLIEEEIALMNIMEMDEDEKDAINVLISI